MTYEMSQVVNFQVCHAGIPADLEIDAVIAEVTEGWDAWAVQETATDGPDPEDLDAMDETIEKYGLTCTLDQCQAALVAWAKSKIARESEDA